MTKRSKTPIHRVPTNILTGFLGAGKTSAILQLLAQKPSDERWAVLVNEFGEIGVDGSLFEGQHQEPSGIYIREVPGGCMCCAAGLPMQMALNMLLARAEPQRLLIEPTGLGHPQEVLQTLSSGYNQELLSIQQVVTLVDARQLADSRYTDHDTFNQQIAIADLIVGNKQDLYGPDEQANLRDYVQANGRAQAQVIFTEQGKIPLDALAGPTRALAEGCDHSHQHGSELGDKAGSNDGLPSEQPLPDSGYLQAINQGEGFASIGWRFSAQHCFERSKLFSLFSGLDVERMKAVFLTDEGVFGYNLTGDGLTEIELEDALESRIEIIATQTRDDWEQQLLDCRKQPNA